jgi:anti-sigma factor RsiW
MTHPTNEELLDLLYDELEPARAEEIDAHVFNCDACRAQLAGWRGVRNELGTWELPESSRRIVVTSTPPTTRAAWWGRSFRAAAAAVLLVGTGYGLARFNTPKPPAPQTAAVDLNALRAQVARDVRSDLGKRLRDQQLQFAAEVLERQQDFQQTVGVSLDKLERRQVARQAALRKDVETLALHAQKELNQLAFSAQGDDVRPKTRDR